MGDLQLGRLTITPSGVLAAALLCYLGQERLLAVFGFSALLHELGHGLAAWCCGVPVTQLRVSASGGAMTLGRPCRPWEEGIILLAGPAVNLVETAVCVWMGNPLAAGAALVLGVLNLLPIGPLDGGQLLRLLCVRLWGAAGEWAAAWLSLLGGAALTAGGWVLFRLAKGTPTLLVFALWLLFFTISSFFPCHFFS